MIVAYQTAMYEVAECGLHATGLIFRNGATYMQFENINGGVDHVILGIGNLLVSEAATRACEDFQLKEIA